MIQYPAIDPIIVSLGPLAIRWYGLTYVIAFAVAWWLGRRRAAQPGSTWKPTDVDDLIFYGALGVILGGRIGWVLFYGFERLIDDPLTGGTPVLLVNPGVALSTRDVFAAWDGVDRGPLDDWREGRNDLEEPARSLVPAVGEVLDWLNVREGATFVRMSGSGATCFAMFGDGDAMHEAAAVCASQWWHLATFLR